MLKTMRKAAGIFTVAATLCLGAMPSAAEANMQPLNECEMQVRSWCAANWEWQPPYRSYETCVAWWLPLNCRETGDGGWAEI